MFKVIERRNLCKRSLNTLQVETRTVSQDEHRKARRKIDFSESVHAIQFGATAAVCRQFIRSAHVVSANQRTKFQHTRRRGKLNSLNILKMFCASNRSVEKKTITMPSGNGVLCYSTRPSFRFYFAYLFIWVSFNLFESFRDIDFGAVSSVFALRERFTATGIKCEPAQTGGLSSA